MCTLKDITMVNAKHGVCGFTAALCAQYDKYPPGKKAIDAATNTAQYVVGEISAFLKRIEGTAHWDEIQTFTRTFGGFDTFNMATWQQSVNQGSLAVIDPNTNEIHHGMAMTPNATKELLDSLGLNPKLTEGSLTNDQAPGKVVGLSKGGGLHKGLKHWVYVNKAGIVWNYGQQTNFKDVSSGSSVSYYITC